MRYVPTVCDGEHPQKGSIYFLKVRPLTACPLNIRQKVTEQKKERLDMKIGGVANVRRETVADALGRDIVGGTMQPGDVVTLEALQSRFGISRTAARDGVKVLESLGLLYSKRRVGLIVRSQEGWNVYAPAVIAWRLESEQAPVAYRELTQLRIAVEPEAAALAAQHRTEAEAREAERLAAEMRWLGEAGRMDEFLTADVAFHRLLLRASRNTLFDALGDVVATVLSGRTDHGLMPVPPRPAALNAHQEVAAGVARRDGATARENMQLLVDEVRTALGE